MMKTRVLILGADGMLGHKLFLGLQDLFDVTGSVRSDYATVAPYGIFDASNTLFGCDMGSEAMLVRALEEAAPQVVVNAIGIVKQRPVSADLLQSLELNAVLPHRLAKLCAKRGARLIHMSTDCVFTGTRGGYIETDVADATDTYGRTKLLGEVTGPGCLTLRTSIIGLELARFRSLIEWFLRQEGRVPGYSHAVFSGLTTTELTRVIAMLVRDHPALDGLYHIASTPISKFALLKQFAVLAEHPVELVPDGQVVIDRSLDGTRFVELTGYSVPSWEQMLSELADELRNR
jgi:dTDP-4-dehydrorhamnose reductase